MRLRQILNLIRWINLLYIILTQVLLQVCVVYPFYNHLSSLSGIKLSPVLRPWEFILVIAATIAIAAAGYMINDYFDIKMDEINKPARIIIDRGISRRQVILGHSFLNIFGVLSGIYLAWKVDILPIGLFQLSAFLLLWYYSTTFKKQFFTGNFVIAFLTALVVLSVLSYEAVHLRGFYRVYPEEVMVLLAIFGSYSFFSFWTTLLRELIKDIEDVEGDAQGGCRTIPIVCGIMVSKSLVSAYVLVLIVALIAGIVFLLRISAYTAAGWIALFIVLPSLGVVWLTVEAEQPLQYRRAGNLVKLIMLAGLLFLLYFHTSIPFKFPYL